MDQQGKQQARSIIWCSRAPYPSPLTVGEVVQLIEDVERSPHSFVFVDTVAGEQVALHLSHISSVSVAAEARS